MNLKYKIPLIFGKINLKDRLQKHTDKKQKQLIFFKKINNKS